MDTPWLSLVLCVHGGFDFLYGFGNGLAQNSTSRFGDENVVFDANTTEVFPFLQFGEVDELFVGAFGVPFVDEGGDEVASWLVGDHEAGLQFSAAAQTT